ncbi:MAG TPA: type II toxin-antitoxin system prevent-host-death family antitoxin [Armatimonadota bacterium]|jgi:prevent-host-death family protein
MAHQEVERIGIYQAKSQLSRLIADVLRGREITITHHGKDVVKLVPVEGPSESVAERMIARRRAAGEGLDGRLAEYKSEGRL